MSEIPQIIPDGVVSTPASSHSGTCDSVSIAVFYLTCFFSESRFAHDARSRGSRERAARSLLTSDPSHGPPPGAAVSAPCHPRECTEFASVK